MTTKPTPTNGGAWRVIDGQLIDESVLPAEPAPVPEPPLPPASSQPRSRRFSTTTPEN